MKRPHNETISMKRLREELSKKEEEE